MSEAPLTPGQFVWIKYPDAKTFGYIINALGIKPVLARVVCINEREPYWIGASHDPEYTVESADRSRRTVYGRFLHPLNTLEIIGIEPETMFAW